MSTGKPRVYNVPAGQLFADTVAQGILHRFTKEPLDLSDITILVPNRRAILTIRNAFLRATGGKPILPPKIRAVGDVEEVSLGFQSWALSDPKILDIPPAIQPMQRQMTLARLVRAFPMPNGKKPESAEAIKLSRALAALLDAIQSEDLDTSKLNSLVSGEHAAHWDTILQFLNIVLQTWPRILAEQGLMDPIERRNALLRAQAILWQQNPPKTPVLSAGVMASTAATCDLLNVVARLPMGAILVPGYDPAVCDEDWARIADDTGEATAHPQAEIARLLSAMGASRMEVESWSHTVKRDTDTPRNYLWREVMRPAASTGAWTDMATTPIPKTALDGISSIRANGPREEATVIAVAIRQALEIPAQTVMLVTPDRGLADRVRGELTRWDIVVDDSAGKPLGTTPVGTLLRLSAAMVANNGAPVPMLACLKHPMVCLGWGRLRYLAALRALENTTLRGPRIQRGLAGLTAHLKTDGEDRQDDRLLLVERLQSAVAPLYALMNSADVSLSQLIQTHAKLCEQLAATDAQDGAAIMWAKDAGHIAAEFIANSIGTARTFGNLPGAAYASVLEAMMAGVVVRPSFGWHPRVQILGLMESRGESADVVILGGLIEGVWPPDPGSDPWMSRSMRADFGLPPSDRRVGQAAHDFVQLASLRRIIMTRSDKVDGAPSVPSRWLLRLFAVLKANGFIKDGKDELEDPAGQELLRWSRALDHRRPSAPIQPPRPKPPVTARPRDFRVTEIGNLICDPYAIYAKHILKLNPLEDVDAALGAGDRGAFIHAALEAFVPTWNDIPAEQRLLHLLDAGRSALADRWDRDTVWAFWWPRFERAAAWFVHTEVERQKRGAPIIMEKKSRLELSAPLGPVYLHGKPDRIDKSSDGAAIIIDYKTGKPPSKAQIKSGSEPQLPLLGLMVQNGVFGLNVPTTISELSYVAVKGTLADAGKNELLPDPNTLIAEANSGLSAVLSLFDDVNTPYLNRPNPNMDAPNMDFDHLARVAEWRTEAGDGK